MTIPILMPSLSPTMEEGKLARWLVGPGDKVAPGDIVAEIETDKATMEVEAADGGVVDRLVVPEGEEGVKVNAPIAILRSGDAADAAPARASPPEEPAEVPAPAPIPVVESQARSVSGKPAASPLARRMALQSGLDLAKVSGTGAHGRIMKADVEAATGRAEPAPAARSPSVIAPAPVRPPPGTYELEPLDGMRATIARRMTESFRDVPHFPLSIDVEADALIEARRRINQDVAEGERKVSLNDLIIKASAVALRQVPEANASFTPEGLAFHRNADIAVAVAVEGGLITPIIRAAETKGVSEIAEEINDLAARARLRRLRPEEYQGGTFSISNLGMFGIRSFASILNSPHGAILSVGSAEPRPVVHDGELAVATVMTLTLTCDHRVVDGAVGARFLQVLKRLIDKPLLMIV